MTGFTLVEMSIVLVVIGMLIGGIYAGKSLVRQSQINSAVTAAQTYISTIASFKQKYNELPGDMADATNYWGAAGGGSGDNYTTSCYGTTTAGSQKTCNGDGNGEIAISGAWTNSYPEMFLAWQHLVNAQMIQGAYTGTAGSAGSEDHVIGTNCPESKLSGGGYGISYLGIQDGTQYWFYGSWGHQIVLGSYNSNNWPSGAIVTSTEALAVDTKYDDGKPGTGVISTVNKRATPTCSDGNSASTSKYDITLSGNNCMLLFTTGY